MGAYDFMVIVGCWQREGEGNFRGRKRARDIGIVTFFMLLYIIIFIARQC